MCPIDDMVVGDEISVFGNKEARPLRDGARVAVAMAVPTPGESWSPKLRNWRKNRFIG